MFIDRLRAVINLSNLESNYNTLKKLNNGKSICAVVKADAYGHGSVECSLHLEKCGCNFFAVTVLKEALEIRVAGVMSDILIFGKTDVRNIDYISKYNFIQTIDSYEYALRLNEYRKKIRVHINIDTGMSRLGLSCQSLDSIEETVEIIRKISKLDYIEISGIYTHFASSDSDASFTFHQKDVFDTLISRLKKENLKYGKVHIQNSSGLIMVKEADYDFARCGIALYGYPPLNTSEMFLPVMSLFAKVIAIRKISENHSVSYGRTFVAKEDMTIATIAIGYADGYPRILSNNDFFYFKGYKLPVIGRVCMGLTMINVSGVDIKEDDEVEIFGHNKLLEPMAKRALTITYELLTNTAKQRIDRVYVKNNE
ncbi:MAG: alanine racemase [Candidatus Izemoplasmatales bacterium]